MVARANGRALCPSVPAAAHIPPPALWLIRIPPVFDDYSADILRSLGATEVKRLGTDHRLIRLPESGALVDSEAAKYLRWNLPVHHAWPCVPGQTDAFVEKAATALAAKFAGSGVQAVLIGAMDAGSPNRYFRTLASNLRGRALQLFPSAVARCPVDDQDPVQATLFCLVGKEGLYAGVQSPRASAGFHPGGTKFISQRAADTISRAGAKIAEALHLLALHRPPPAAGSRWLELGASPGGMTSELLRRGYRVTAVDRAPLDGRLADAAGLVFVREDVAAFAAAARGTYAGILCDLNGPAQDSIRHVIRVSAGLAADGLIVFTLKAAGAESFGQINALFDQVTKLAEEAGLRLMATHHLTYNRREFTLFFTR